MTTPRVLVIGGANLDLKAQTDSAHIPATSNPGRLSSSAGGVGRNVAENLARLGTRVELVAAIGSDPFGAQLREATAAAGVVLDRLVMSSAASGTYLAVLDDHGDLVTGVADMTATDQLSPADLRLDQGLQAELLVLDCNLPVAVLETLLDLAAREAIPVVVDPVSVVKSARVRDLLNPARPILALTPNLDELAALTGMPTDDHADQDAAADALLARGVEVVWVRRGRAGSRLYRTGAAPAHVPATTVVPVDVTGAGDAMTAGFVHALVRGQDAVGAARFGAVAAALTVASQHTVRPDLTHELVESHLSKEF